MGLKLETILILGIVIILSASYIVKIGGSSSDDKAFTKELEFANTTLIEVDTTTMKGRTFTIYGVKDKDVLTLYDIKYHILIRFERV